MIEQRYFYDDVCFPADCCLVVFSLSSKGRIVACCRNPDQVSKLQNRRIQYVKLDLTDPASIDAAGAVLRDEIGRVDVLWNVAGILGTPEPERSLAQLTSESCSTTLAVNCIGPLLLTQQVMPLAKAQQRIKGIGPFIVANLSARVGSISDNNLGGWYSYRLSKAALNQATRTLALELRRSGTAVALHPGTTATDLSRPYHRNVKEGSLFPVEFTAEQLLNVVDALDPAVHGGGFYDWAGKAISY